MYLKKHLQRHLPQGVLVSADDWQVFAGEIWLDRIEQELREVSVVILRLSPQSVQRPWINFEGGAASLAHRAVIPVCFHGLKKGQMPKPYSGIQSLDLPDDLYYLLRSGLHQLDPNASPPPPPYVNDYQDEEIKAALEGRRQVLPLSGFLLCFPPFGSWRDQHPASCSDLISVHGRQRCVAAPNTY